MHFEQAAGEGAELERIPTEDEGSACRTLRTFNFNEAAADESGTPMQAFHGSGSGSKHRYPNLAYKPSSFVI